ncbi:MULTISPECIES: hypothetical protein [Chryseobacterium]|uniref:DUF4919 domain-containing protein n=1 Tax=Chryseobacterium salivictor TaxID=2547600 RepID=A0A4P6ZJ32_9FLAO|nr:MULTISPECIES: hypothetical protein [Chryseobacterium]MDQ0476322.1 hypothetical protein [Chryseobacterium sp. MDT2-18]QBO59415.1 hypothetical protein NBC122_02613 [Chryseobacterium salivictor]
MKNLILFFLLLISLNLFSQNSEDYKTFIEKIKKDSKTDKADKTVYHLFNDFYEQGLQSDQGELSEDISQRIQKLYSDKKAKNLQILTMFLLYQNHITETAAVGKQPDPNFQINLIKDLESELKNTYGSVPIIINIYKAEALNSAGATKESAEIISNSLIQYPNSVPLKVYKYLDTKDEKIKKDLVDNHTNHWMVKQFGIK